MSKPNYLHAAENWNREHTDLARGILSGRIKSTPENDQFYRDWARRFLAHHGIADNEEVPKATGLYESKGEATANDLPAEDPNQGRLF